MAHITYTRPSGTEITVVDSDETQALAEANGWIVSKPKTKTKSKSKAK